MKEEWKPVRAYESYYLISSYGRIASLQKGFHILHPRRDIKGRRIILLCKYGSESSFKVARLVAEAFVPNPDNKPLVCHKDGRKWNDAYWNLAWMDYQEAPNFECAKQNWILAMSKRKACTYEKQNI